MKLLMTLSFCLFSIGTAAFAGVEIGASPRDVFHRGSNELAGTINFSVSGDDFANASPQSPIYIKLALSQGASLRSTLVDLNGSSNVANPIYLKVGMTEQFSLSLGADADALSIVRWVAGENAIWLRVQASDFIFDGITSLPPNNNFRVFFSLGASARVTYEQGSNVHPSYKNLPYNTRNASLASNYTGTDEAVSTLLCLNLSSSSLSLNGCEAYVEITPTAYASDAEVSSGVYADGTDLAMNFTGSARIALPKDISCMGFPTKPALVVDHLENAQDQELTNTIDLTLACQEGAGFLAQALRNGSYFSFRTSGNVGFTSQSANFVGADPGLVFVRNSFDAGGQTLYRTLDLSWNDVSIPLGQESLSVALSVTVPANTDISELVVDWDFVLVTGDGPYDEAPFDGLDQPNRCIPSEFMIQSDSWLFAREGVAPAIVHQPAALTYAMATDLVLLEVEASGDNLSYQWRRNGHEITGATSARFELPQGNDPGRYDCEISGFGDPRTTELALVRRPR